MSYKFIPRKALRLGAESLSENNVAYGKSRISGSLRTTYILHSKGGSMPGQKELFSSNSLTQPDMNMDIYDNQIINSYKRKRQTTEKHPIGAQSTKTVLDSYTYKEYAPIDDQSLDLAIKASHRQIFGNIHCMESERPIELERRLRNGDLTIRNFIRQLAKSEFYKYHFFERVSQERSIELNIKHILGRAAIDQTEIQKNIELIYRNGFDAHIDSLIDSEEYDINFGSDIVPYYKSWNSPSGSTSKSFLNISTITRFFASSDNALHGLRIPEYSPAKHSKLIHNLFLN